jgi:hypothetical protein
VNPAPTKVTKHALQEQGGLHEFYGVAGDADGVDAVGGFAGADEEFAGAVGLRCAGGAGPAQGPD